LCSLENGLEPEEEFQSQRHVNGPVETGFLMKKYQAVLTRAEDSQIRIELDVLHGAM
jgi:hypothetical protein